MISPTRSARTRGAEPEQGDTERERLRREVEGIARARGTGT
ncbi:hypothetical protein ACFS5L_10490 [Streptomyces phyllanthi]|nr:hypothetical protein [Streptomyces phyllanthi]